MLIYKKHFSSLLLIIILFLILTILFNDNVKDSFSKNFTICDNNGDNFKIHVSYVHHIDTKNQALMENFKFFMFFGVQPCDSRVDYRIILNMNNISDDVNNKVAKVLADDELMSQIRNCSNVVIIKNKNTLDLCVQSEQLKTEYWKSVKHKYKYFFFINSTPRGPFLPNYWTEPWWKIFTNLFRLNSKLVATGPYLSTEFHPHIQSFFIVLDLRGLEILESTWRCRVEKSVLEWIINTEVVKLFFLIS